MGAPTSSSTSEPRALIRTRVRIFVVLLFGVFAATFVFDRVTALVMHGTFWAHPHANSDALAHLLEVLLLGGMLLGLRSKDLATRDLTRIEALATISSAVALGLMVQPLTGTARPELYLLLGMIDILVFRAAIVPSSPRRTAITGLVVLSVVLVAALNAQGWQSTSPTPRFLVTGVGLWGGMAVLASTIIASVIYGLRARAREARELGRYVLEERIGAGGMGSVYRARHAFLRRPTAVKVLDASLSGETNIARFEREVQRTSELAHPNVVSVYDFGRSPDGAFYYAMELLDGVDLQRVVAETGPQPASRVVHLLVQAADGLAAAHRNGLVHRDVKPANLFVCRHPRRHDLVKVLDFGVVRELGRPGLSRDASLAGALVGTPAYLAPESISDGATAGPSADIYALGAVAYYLLTGTEPFRGNTVIEVCSKHLYEPVEPPSVRLGSPIDTKLEALVLACLSKSPADRPATAAALRAALLACDVGSWSADAARAWWETRPPSAAAEASAGSGPKTLAMAARGSA